LPYKIGEKSAGITAVTAVVGKANSGSDAIAVVGKDNGSSTTVEVGYMIAVLVDSTVGVAAVDSGTSWYGVGVSSTSSVGMGALPHPPTVNNKKQINKTLAFPVIFNLQ
jgi:hypothetical protein